MRRALLAIGFVAGFTTGALVVYFWDEIVAWYQDWITWFTTP